MQRKDLQEELMTRDLRTSSTLGELLFSRFRLRTERVCMVGLGYVGLPLAETFAWGGFPVLGFDIDPEKVRLLNDGKSYIGHIDSTRVAELRETRRFEATTETSRLHQADVLVICVPTPLGEAPEADP